MYERFFFTLKQQKMTMKVVRKVRMAVAGIEMPSARASVSLQSSLDS